MTPALLSELRLLYLGFAFPPGMAALYPECNPAGHALETRMAAQLRSYFDLRSVGVLPVAPPQTELPEPVPGIDHELLLLERPPELFHRYRSLARLKAQYRLWRAEGWEPDLVLVYNLSPIYNQFLLWLRRQAHCPKLVLLLLDSSNLGQAMPWTKRFRRSFKPMYVPDNQMLFQFDACIGLSRTVAKYFQPRGVPFLWMPGGCTPERALSGPVTPLTLAPDDVTRFGYFGALGAHSGVSALVELFAAQGLNATLDVCGYGKNGLPSLPRNSRVRLRGLLSPEQCLRFGRNCDVLINPRPATHGNENNFPSKLFEYVLTGRPIITSRLSGVERVLGQDAIYFNPRDFAPELAAALRRASQMPRSELQARGAAIQQRVLAEFSWAKQARRMADFMCQLCRHQAAVPELAGEALAA